MTELVVSCCVVFAVLMIALIIAIADIGHSIDDVAAEICGLRESVDDLQNELAEIDGSLCVVSNNMHYWIDKDNEGGEQE